MHSDLRRSTKPSARLEVILDGKPVSVPPLRCSLAAIRSYLERMALEQQRILCAFSVDGRSLGIAESMHQVEPFARVEAKTIDLAEVPMQLLQTARVQTSQARERVAAAVATVLINCGRQAREYWWELGRDLKQPLLTLSLMPSTLHIPANGSASLMQLRKWQLEQLATILKEVDETCWSADPMALSNALENRVLPWLDGLSATLDLWYETLATARPASA